MVPTTLVIFGATGDLARQKLIPALFDLFTKNMLPADFRIIGLSRKNLSDQEFREFGGDALKSKKIKKSKKTSGKFLEQLYYQPGDFSRPESYKALSEKLTLFDNERGQCSNKLFYLAVPPGLYDPIFQNLHDSGISRPCSDESGWARILVEKPFGRDLDTARMLDRKLGLLFEEEQIFRIDHYLAKETLQNIVMFRFSNVLFEPLWNRSFIKRIDIRLFEKSGIGGRGSFYNDVGALRDVGQNHILQMLALVAMERPESLGASALRKNRAKVLEMLRPLSPESMKRMIIRGQYRGYLREKNISPDSATETYFKIGAYIDNDRWQGVPFVLEAGKKMPEDLTEISITFKAPEHVTLASNDDSMMQNVLTFYIRPKEGISVWLCVKKPGFKSELERRELSFSYGNSRNYGVLPDAYERILYDCIQGDQSLFASTEEVVAAWRFITPILQSWQNLPLKIY